MKRIIKKKRTVLQLRLYAYNLSIYWVHSLYFNFMKFIVQIERILLFKMILIWSKFKSNVSWLVHFWHWCIVTRPVMWKPDYTNLTKFFYPIKWHFLTRIKLFIFLRFYQKSNCNMIQFQDTNSLLQQRLEHTDTNLNQKLQQTTEVRVIWIC